MNNPITSYIYASINTGKGDITCLKSFTIDWVGNRTLRESAWRSRHIALRVNTNLLGKRPFGMMFEFGMAKVPQIRVAPQGSTYESFRHYKLCQTKRKASLNRLRLTGQGIVRSGNRLGDPVTQPCESILIFWVNDLMERRTNLECRKSRRSALPPRGRLMNPFDTTNSTQTTSKELPRGLEARQIGIQMVRIREANLPILRIRDQTIRLQINEGFYCT